MSARSVTAAILVLLVAGFATWLLLPLTSEPANVQLPPTTFITQVGPFEVNWMLLVLLVALGAPMPALMLALLLRWFGSKAAGGATPALEGEGKPVARAARAPVKAAAAATMTQGATVAAQELSTAQKLMFGLAIVVAIVVLVALMILILPPGFRLF